MLPVHDPDPDDLVAWQAWSAHGLASAAPHENTYLPTHPVFSVLDGDVPTRRKDVHLLDLGQKGVGIFSREPAACGVLEHADFTLLERVLDAIDGTRPVAAVLDRGASADTREVARAYLQRLLGTAVDLPDAVRALEHRIAHTEVVRYPMQDAYAVPRPYWSNAGDVRAALPRLLAALPQAAGFSRELSRLHVLATMGAGGRSFHGGGGEVEMVPGRYRTERARTHTAHPALVVFVRERLRELGLSEALTDDVSFESPAGAPLGRLSSNGCTYELQPASPTWMAAGLEEIRHALARLEEAVRERAPDPIVSHAAALHHLFCHVHPFERINNSLIMNVVNACLQRAGLRTLPHLLLDHFALRLDLDRYSVVFRDALRRHGLPSGDSAVPQATLDELARFRAHVSRLNADEAGPSGS